MPRFTAALISVAAAAWLTGACAGSTDRVRMPSPVGPGDTVGTAPNSDACDHTKARWAVGERATQELLEKAQKAAGARSARFLRPGQAITMEFIGSRLNLELDEQEIVRSVRCG